MKIRQGTHLPAVLTAVASIVRHLITRVMFLQTKLHPALAVVITILFVDRIATATITIDIFLICIFERNKNGRFVLSTIYRKITELHGIIRF